MQHAFIASRRWWLEAVRVEVTVKGLTVLKLQVDDGERFEDEEDEWKEPLRAAASGPGSSYEALLSSGSMEIHPKMVTFKGFEADFH